MVVFKLRGVCNIVARWHVGAYVAAKVLADSCISRFVV